MQTEKAQRAAYCDIDGTLAATTIVTPLVWFRRRVTSAPAFALWQASLVFRGPYWLILDRISRDKSNRAIYSNYAGLKKDDVLKLSRECYDAYVKPKLFAGAIEHLRGLKNEGVSVVLVTGGLDFLMTPLAEELGATLIAPTLLEKNGVFTGELNRTPLTGHEKALAVREHAKQSNISLDDSFAYGDAFGDLEMLECAGHPVAVRPDARLKQIAAERNWRVEHWQ
jgi:alcohol-forming fatty acyl-CoA reductase